MATVDFDTVYIFGDSFSDTGASGGAPGTRNGPRTDGGTAASYLAEAIGNPVVLPNDRSIGTSSINFAETGARVGEQSSRGASPLSDQVDNLIQLVGDGEASFDSADTLFFLAGGLNDAATTPADVIADYTDQVVDLIGLGARYIEIALLPTGVPQFTNVANTLNPLYVDLVSDLDTLFSDVSISLSNWGGYFDDILARPGDFGFTNTTDAFVNTDQTGNPDEFFYFFPAHPGDAAHQIVGQKLFEELSTIEEIIPTSPPPGAPQLTVSGLAYDLSDFEHQNTGSFSVSSDGLSLIQNTNAWTELSIAGGITVTANTVLRFDFSSTDEGELHGVEFDIDGVPTSNRGFQIFGTQSGIYNEDFDTYTAGDGTVTFEIPVGQYFTGTFNSLVFFSDDDKQRGANSIYSNIELFEATTPPPPPPPAPTELVISGQDYQLSEFTHQNTGSFTLEDGGLTLVQGTDAWTQASVAGGITVTANTVLRFDFSSTDEGEIHGVEFDIDGVPTSAHGFQLFGTQSGIYNEDFDTYSIGDGTVTFEIPVGQYFTGTFNSLVFFSDDDRGRGANSTFSNIELFESATPPTPPAPAPTELVISGQDYQLSEFTHQNTGTYRLEDGGRTLVQGTDAWTEAFVNGGITVNANTVLRFDFSSTDEGELHGVEFDNDDIPTTAHGFQVYGTQSGIYNEDFNTYSAGDGTVTYEIPVGQFFTGTFDSLVFFSDDDRGRGANSTFSNIELFDIA